MQRPLTLAQLGTEAQLEELGLVDDASFARHSSSKPFRWPSFPLPSASPDTVERTGPWELPVRGLNPDAVATAALTGIQAFSRSSSITPTSACNRPGERERTHDSVEQRRASDASL